MDSFMQHDVQELNRVLCDNLEEKMKVSYVLPACCCSYAYMMCSAGYAETAIGPSAAE